MPIYLTQVDDTERESPILINMNQVECIVERTNADGKVIGSTIRTSSGLCIAIKQTPLDIQKIYSKGSVRLL